MYKLRFAAALGLLMLVPNQALAWGPAAHLELGLAVLADLALVAPAVAALLARFRDDFLYGSLAADITIGKNFSPYQLHCHNWQVGFSVLDLCEKESTRAFAWGYLCHLAADVVAHNYFVPYKTVEHYSRRGAAHTYWELRFDVHVPKQVWDEGRRLSGRTFKAHDRHLRKILTGPLFSFPVNKQIFNSIVQFSRLLRVGKLAEAHTRRSRRVLTEAEWQEARDMALSRLLDLLSNGHEAACLQADPTGHRNLLIATDLRSRLRRFKRQGLLKDPDQVGMLFKPIFREAIESKLRLPALSDLLDPQKPDTLKKRLRGLLRGKTPAKARTARAENQQERQAVRSVERKAKKVAKKTRRQEQRTKRLVDRAHKRIRKKASKEQGAKQPGKMFSSPRATSRRLTSRVAQGIKRLRARRKPSEGTDA